MKRPKGNEEQKNDSAQDRLIYNAIAPIADRFQH